MQLEGDSAFAALTDPDDSPPWMSPSSAAVARIESQAQGLIDAMAAFSAPAADAALMAASHQFTIMPIIAAQYAA